MQNLTAHYNILFNAREIIRLKQEAYAAGYIDAYDELLSVYQDTIAHSPTAADKDLDAAIARANIIIAEKDQSRYIGDANLILGKSNHLYGRYFNSVEYFKYVTLAFPKNKELVQEARVWMARSLMYLNQIPLAKAAIDSTLKNINPKKSITADVYATTTQFYINTAQYADAEVNAKLAVRYARNKAQRLRWTFVLAQLQELNKEPQDAYLNYSSVVKSNASFEMAFNADLNRIRLEDSKANRSLTRMERLKRLLKDDKNEDFIDQIYYQMALLYLADNDIANTIKNLQLSIRYSTKNQNQKGLSYLRLADISFKNQADYVKAKKYYDSSLVSLAPTYPDYKLIQKKADNLQVLADRLQTISREDTLQMLAKLSETDRAARIDELVKAHTAQLKAEAAAVAPDPLNSNYNNKLSTVGSVSGGPSNFYFDNPASISQGIGDFKRVWGARKLEDNWRRSKKSGGDIVTNTNNSPAQDAAVQSAALQNTTEDVEAATYRQKLVQNLPLTPALLDQSNMRVYNGYTDIANFYRDVLGDKKEAIEAYESLLTRYPNDPNKPAVYYNLYRLYSGIDPAKSEKYKNLLLNTFPSSVYAKVILDPDYNKKLDDKDAELNGLYNQIFDTYVNRKYTAVVTSADSLLRAYPDNKLSAQLLYLRAIANGHQEKFEPFKAELAAITDKYPKDQLMNPLISQHLLYLEANKAKMSARQFALVDNDPTEEPFLPNVKVITTQQIADGTAQNPHLQKPTTQPAAQKPAAQAVVSKPQVVVPPVVTPPVTSPPVSNQVASNPPVVNNPVINANPPATTTTPNTTVTPPAPVVKSIYSLRDSLNYFFVVNVSTGTANLSSSRFGVGQFNRANYAGTTISHQLKNAGVDNQLVYVGKFASLKAVKDYARAIIPLMPQIMKVPADKYSFFIITQENLDKLADKKTLDSYIDFYQKNY